MAPPIAAPMTTVTNTTNGHHHKHVHHHDRTFMEVRPAANQPKPIKASKEPPSKTIKQDPNLTDKVAVAKAMKQAGVSEDEVEATVKQLEN